MKDFSLQAKMYVLGSILVGSAITGWNLYTFNYQHVWLLLILGGLSSLTLILKVEGPTKRSHYNISFLVYGFAFVILGPQAAMLVVLASNLVEWIWRKYPWYIQCFNIASYIIVIQLAGMVFTWVNPGMTLFTLVGIAGTVLALGVFTLLNHLMIGIVVWLARGESFSKSGVFDFLPLMIDFTLPCMGAATGLVWLFNPYAIVLTLLPLYLIYATLKVPALERQSETDPKTGLFNAKYFGRALENELNRANRFDRPMTVVMADLDLLRNINNTYGHLAGDEVLIGVAKILKESVREYDVVARFGGEEFSILIPESTPMEVFERIEAIRTAVETAEFSVPTSVTPIQATLSLGISGREGFNQSPGDIIHNADAALYHAKLKGRNKVYIYSENSIEGLFTVGKEDINFGSEMSLEDRIHHTGMPFVPNPLRAAPIMNMLGPEPKAEPTQDTPSATKRSGSLWLLNAFIAGITLTGSLLLALFYHSAPLPDWIGLSAFALMVVLTEYLSIDIYVRETSVSTSAAPMLAGILLYGPVGAVVLSGTFAITATLKHRSPISRLIFNFSNQLLAGMVYTSLIVLVVGSFTEWSPVFQIVLTVLSAMVVYLITTIAIAFAMHLDLGIPFKHSWKEKFSWLTPYYVFMGLIAYALIFSYQSAGLIGNIIILMPLLLVRFSQKQYIERTTAMVTELREKNVVLGRTSEEITKLNEGLLNALSESIDMRDPFVLGHSQQVTRYAVKIARKLGLHPKRVELIRKASLLHDIGKLGVPDGILLKPGKLRPEEYNTVKEHTVLGARILESSHALKSLIPIVRHHHERYDGKGYPDRLAGTNIPLEARIVALADAVEAMASDRPYRKALQAEAIVYELKNNAGTQFDPMMVDAFLEIMAADGESFVVNSARKYLSEKSSSLQPIDGKYNA